MKRSFKQGACARTRRRSGFAIRAASHYRGTALQGAGAVTDTGTEATSDDAAATRLRGDTARDRLRQTALELFSRHGVDGVSVRDIVSAARMRNGASLHYYFGSRQNLIRELILDCARRSDRRRRERLDALEARGGPRALIDIVRILIEAEIAPDDSRGDEAGLGLGHTRFLLSLQINHRRLLSSTIADNDVRAAYRVCIGHLRRFLPHLDDRQFRDRMVLSYTYITSTLAAREAALLGPATERSMWASPQAIEHLVITTCALMEAGVPEDAPHDGASP